MKQTGTGCYRLAPRCCRGNRGDRAPTLGQFAANRRWSVYLMGMLRLRQAVLVTLAVLAALPASAQPLPTLGPLDGGRVPYFIEEGEPGSSYAPADRDLATWAFKSWERAIGGRVRFEPTAKKEQALVVVHWVPAGGGEYGEMRSVQVGGRHGAAVYIRPDTNSLGRDIAEV